jgi:hypothetical protein
MRNEIGKNDANAKNNSSLAPFTHPRIPAVAGDGGVSGSGEGEVIKKPFVLSLSKHESLQLQDIRDNMTQS